jgi:HSP20 family protein
MSGDDYGGGPFSVMRRISDEMDRLFENFGMGRGGFPGFEQGGFGEGQPTQNVPSMWSPHIEVCERNGKLLIQADLPGIKRDDINVQIEQDAIVIQGQRHQQQTSNQGGYYRSERSYGSFYRTIPLPEGTNAESASASFRDGVLEIELDMPRPQQRGRTLEIRDGGGCGACIAAPGRRAGDLQHPGRRPCDRPALQPRVGPHQRLKLVRHGGEPAGPNLHVHAPTFPLGSTWMIASYTDAPFLVRHYVTFATEVT